MRVRSLTWAVAGLAAVLVFDVWWRCHTVGPTLRDRLGVNLYPVTGIEAEPLDCDEAVYAYIGKRIAGGAVMYRDLTENKPPLGYWLFALAAGIGGANELTVRLMPVPFVLGTVALVWWLALRLRGPGAAVLAALVFAVVSTDPFLYGNGDQMEHMINLFATASLALVVRAWDRPGRAGLIAAGACLGASALVKQVAAVNGVVFALAVIMRGNTRPPTPALPHKGGGGQKEALPGSAGGNLLEALPPCGGGLGGGSVTAHRDPNRGPRMPAGRVKDVAALALGFFAVCGIAATVLIAQGAGRDAIEDVFRYGPALATDVPGDPHAPPLLVRWFSGNSDPSGELPWPFGRSNYLVWWGSGTWPVWLAAVPGLVWLSIGPGASAPRRLVAAWTLSAWVQVALPRLFWPHYYLLPVPGLAVVVAVFFADLVASARGRRGLRAVGALTVALALAWTARTQVKEYLMVPPQEVTVRDKGGRQWVTLRDLGRELRRRSAVWPRPTLHVWGWQSPLFVYSRLDGVTRQVFADDLIKTFAGAEHPRVRPRIDRTMRELRANPPSLILAGYPPFPELRAFLNERYLPSHLSVVTPDGRGLWVERSKYGAFETYHRE